MCQKQRKAPFAEDTDRKAIRPQKHGTPQDVSFFDLKVDFVRLSLHIANAGG